MTKQELRSMYRKKRSALSDQERDKLDDLLLIRFQSLQLPPFQRLFAYWPSEKLKEPSTHLIVRDLQFKLPGLELAYPRCNATGDSFNAILVDEATTFTESAMGITEPDEGLLLEPSEADLVLVPLLAVDQEGYRVGYGKGMYDRFLQGCRPDCLTIGLSYFEPVDKIDDKQEFDVPLNICITPAGTYVF